MLENHFTSLYSCVVNGQSLCVSVRLLQETVTVWVCFLSEEHAKVMIPLWRLNSHSFAVADTAVELNDNTHRHWITPSWCEPLS